MAATRTLVQICAAHDSGDPVISLNLSRRSLAVSPTILPSLQVTPCRCTSDFRDYQGTPSPYHEMTRLLLREFDGLPTNSASIHISISDIVNKITSSSFHGHHFLAFALLLTQWRGARCTEIMSQYIVFVDIRVFGQVNLLPVLW